MTDPASAGAPTEAPSAAAPAMESATPESATPANGLDASGRPWPAFAHGSEAEMARILDFYDVRWEYEPRTFPILWNLDGDVVESFSPDFYLPELDLFLEMTTLKQRLVRKKNRKLRRLREAYPDIRIKLFYARDFRAMLLKYGRLALADSLSGTLGQVTPDRGREPDADPGAQTAPASGLVQPKAGVALGRPALDGVAQSLPAPRGTGEAPSLRRNASRSRRRRAAAARAAARVDDRARIVARSGDDEEVRGPR